MLKPLLALIFLFPLAIVVYAQTDSLRQQSFTNEVEVTGYLSRQPLLQTPASVAVIGQQQLQNQQQESLLPAVNLVPGVRMEERSPGSYRLSLRGSLLRSPFGIRNVKIYLNDLPLTDASGNTYLNLLEPRSLHSIEILKGPDGSLFGANSGGVVLLKTQPNTAKEQAEIHFSGGSFGLFHESAGFQKKTCKAMVGLQQGFQRSDGYRENSAMRRHYVQASVELPYLPENTLKFFAFYSDLSYQTPGGLTLPQFQEKPDQARPAAGINPGAAEQKAGISNKTLFGGVTHVFGLSSRANHVFSVFGNRTTYQNPFITNFEQRNETNLGTRTYLEILSADSSAFSWKWTTGLEAQQANQRIYNYDNLGGTKGNMQAADKFISLQHFYFTRFAASPLKNLTTEAALSTNFNRYQFNSLPEAPLSYSGKKNFAPEWMPRFAASYLLTKTMAVRATASKGFSPPTIAEIRPSGTEINTHLKPEKGWNYEVGLRYSHAANRFQADAVLYNYRLQEAIVRRTTTNDTEIFTNAGGTRQTGAELLFSGWIIQAANQKNINALQLTASYTYQHFRFANYLVNDADFSGNRLTGVPANVANYGFVIHFLQKFTLAANLNTTSRLSLNDANSVFAESYQLAQARLSWKKLVHQQYSLEIFAGADNILNQKYSLGHDINAFGNRYYNPAPPLNFYAGIAVRFAKQVKTLY